MVKAPDGTVSLDFGGKKPGRGAYVCHDVACLQKAGKPGPWNGPFDTAIRRRSTTPWRQNCEVRMDRLNILSLLGLSLRGGRLAVGEEPVEAVARARDARVLLLAADAAEGTRRRCEHFAQAGDCLWLQLPFTKAELGRALGRTAVAITAVTDVGRRRLLHRLAELDPEQYADAADRMDVKAAGPRSAGGTGGP